jgi:predicted component of type VI protein secretion system
LAELVEAVRLAPGVPELRLRLAASYEEFGRLEEAIAQYRAVLDQDPGHAEAAERLRAALERPTRSDRDEH